MRTRPRLAVLTLALALWAGAAAAASFEDLKAAAERRLDGGATAPSATLDQIVERGELIMAVYRDFPPFSYQNGGKLAGIDVDIGTELAKRMKLKPRFFPLTAGETVDDDLRNAVWKGHYLERRVADVMLHVPTERAYALRQTEAVLFAPYFRDRIAVARNPDKVNARDGVAVFAEEKVGVEVDGLADVYLTGALGGTLRSNVTHYPSHAKAVDGLLAGEVAAVMGVESEIAARMAARRSPWPLAPMDTPGLAKTGWEVGLAVKHSNRDLAYALGDAIDALRREGVIAAIFKRHRIPYHAPED